MEEKYSLTLPPWIGKNEVGIYGIQCAKNGRIYIGRSRNIRRRLVGHYSKLKQGRHPNRYLQEDFNRYGISYFRSRVIMRCNPDDLLEKEQYFINVDSRMYNIVKFADSSILPEETKGRISEGLMGNTNCIGHKMSEQTKRKLSLSLRGRWISDETRHKMALAKLGRPSNAKGKHWQWSKNENR